ncbi:MAG: hypothetical protein JSV05_03695 [Candidatus Bathyarchaeota archaeon]|nr:MAG: hypothetical protein JSV05_03695 [Candidatus Bathyarchaeota archaeon]
MSGIFGTKAVLITDVNLLIQIIAFALIFVGFGYKTKAKFRNHGVVMGAAVFLHLISFLIAMGPSFLDGFEFFTTDTSLLGVQTMWVHAVTGAIALVLGIVIVASWIVRVSDIAACTRRKRLMDVTVLLWLISLIFGIATYINFYL